MLKRLFGPRHDDRNNAAKRRRTNNLTYGYNAVAKRPRANSPSPNVAKRRRTNNLTYGYNAVAKRPRANSPSPNAVKRRRTNNLAYGYNTVMANAPRYYKRSYEGPYEGAKRRRVNQPTNRASPSWRNRLMRIMFWRRR